MFEQMFETFRKASESSLQMQQDFFKHWGQQWFTASPNAATASAEWGKTFQKRSMDLALEMLHRHRETLDSTYKSGIQVIEHTMRMAEARSGEDYRRMAEQLGDQLLTTIRDQSNAQFHEFHNWASKSLELLQTARGA
jgi:hypothetical protein